MHNTHKFEQARAKLVGALALMEIAKASIATAVEASEKSIKALDTLINAEKKKKQLFDPVLLLRVDGPQLALTVRTFNCLKSVDIYFVGDLIQRTESDLLQIENLGRRSLNEIKEALALHGHSLGTKKLPGWPPAGLATRP